MAVKRKSSSSFINQASKDALVRFGGTQQQLNELLKQAQGTYRQTVSAARGGALVQQKAIDAALPANEAAHAASLARRQALTGGLQQDLAGLGGGVSKDIAAATNLEQAGGTARIGDEATRNVWGLNDQRVRAAQGAVYAGTQARNQLAGDLEKIYGKQSTLTDQIGAYTESQADKYSQTDFNDQVKLEGLDQGQQRIDAAAAKAAAKKGSPRKSADQHIALQDTVGAAQRWAQTMKKNGFGRHEISAALISGKIPKEWKDAGVTVPPATKQTYASVALDLTYDKGYISRKNADRLHRGLGYSLKHLGYSIAPKKKPKSLQQAAADAFPQYKAK